MTTRKTNPNHKAGFTIGVRCSCSCGWTTGWHPGKGAKSGAAAEWRSHRAQCEEEGRDEA